MTQNLSRIGTVLVLGSGGREHALVQSCLASPLVARVLCAPGNGGIERDCPCLPVEVADPAAVVALARREGVDFVIVGPEVPLCAGVVDALEDAGLVAYGPRKAAARLEGSKVFTKEFLFRHRIPTAASSTFASAPEAHAYVRQLERFPVVVKASGLAAGKGVLICQTRAEAEEAVRRTLEEGEFGASGSEILIEDFLEGEEASITVMVSGEKYVMLPASQDHKRVGDGDSGPNTGGMGAYCPAEVVTPAVERTIIETIVEPTLRGLVADGVDYRGTLYVGVMLTARGPQVLEFNVRFGDPETQVLLPMLGTDPVALMHDCATGRLVPSEVVVRKQYAVVVVMAAQGYPGVVRKGDRIALPPSQPAQARVVHGGVRKLPDGTLVTDGGRVLGVVGWGPTLGAAVSEAYALCGQVHFAGAHYRKDIAYRQLARERQKPDA